MDGKLLRPKIRSCSICDPFVLIIREDDSLGLFIGEAERGKIRRKDMTAMGDKVGFRFCLIIYLLEGSLFTRPWDGDLPFPPPSFR